MGASRFAGPLLLVGALLAMPGASWAEPPAGDAGQEPTAQSLKQEIDQLKQDCSARLAALEARLAAIEGGAQTAAPAATGAAQSQPTAEVPQGAQGAGGPSGALPVYGSASAASKIFNPDIAVIGNFLGAAGK